MPLNDLIKDYSLTTISQKTNIPIGILEQLLNKEWEKLQGTKAKGFIRIIEREFDLDLSELKEEANEYYKTHKKDEPQRPIDLVDAQTISNGSKVVTNIVALLAFLLVVYAVWFYFFKPKSDLDIIEKESNSSGMIKESINSAKALVGMQDETQKERPKQESITTQKDNSTKKEETTKESNSIESKKFDITTDVKSSNETTLVTNSEQNKTTTTLTLADKQKEENKTINSQVESLLEENSTAKKESNEQNSSSTQNSFKLEQNTTQTENLALNEQENNATAANTITIKPRAKTIWIGIYNLKTNKKIPKIVRGEFNYNADGAEVAIITGHSKFNISTDNGESKKFTGKRKRYILVSKDGIKELTKSEYRALTKRKAW